MLEIKNLSKKFWQGKDEFLAVDRLNLKVAPGSVFGFLGLNGAGKTTTIKVLTDLLFADSGGSTWKNRPTQGPASKAKTGFMPEQPQFPRHLTASEVLGYVGALFELEPALITKRTQALLKEVGLADRGASAAGQFSKGMNQRLGLAVALINEPELLILDEPLDGLDPIGRAEFKLIIRTQRQKGRTVFFSSHILADVEELCDQIGVLHRGKLVFTGAPKELAKPGQSLEAAFVELVKR
ncbi:MAG: ABC transporter ATP-binding protein [Patescibacteria group bacterium]